MTTPQKNHCYRCGKIIERASPIVEKKDFIIPTRMICESCSAAQEAEILRKRQKEEKSQRLHRWNEICPGAYRESNPARLPKAPLARVLAWKENQQGQGLLLIGPPRLGKTRCTWLLLRRLFLDEAVPITVLADTTFAHECSFRFSNNTSREWIQRLCAARVLFLDDLGKAVPTERYRHELFHIIDQRISWNRPLLVTTNLDGEELAERIGDNAGIAIVERLRECCEVIRFNPSDFQT